MSEDTPAVDNGRRMKVLMYDEADAPMVAAALRLGANVAMCGGREGARARMKNYARSVMENVPPEASFFNMEDVWTEIMIAIDNSPTFEVKWRRGDYGRKGTAEVVVGKRSWRTDMGSISEQDAISLGDVFERLAPMDCRRIRHDAPVTPSA